MADARLVLRRLDQAVWRMSYADESSKKDRGMYAGGGLVVERFAEVSGIPASEIESAVSLSPLLESRKANVRKGLLTKKEVPVSTAAAAPAREGARLARDDFAQFAKHARLLPLSSLPSWLDARAGAPSALAAHIAEETPRVYSPPPASRDRILDEQMPEMLKQYRRELSAPSERVSVFTRRVARGRELAVAPGKTASSVQSWVQCVMDLDQAAGITPDELAAHARWLSETARCREMAVAAGRVQERAKSSGWDAARTLAELQFELVHSAFGPLVFQKVIQPLIDRLDNSASAAVADAAGRLGRLGDRRAVEPLCRALFASDARSAVAAALGRLGDARAVPFLEKLLKTTQSDEERAACVSALGAIDDPRSEEALEGFRDTPGRAGELAREELAKRAALDASGGDDGLD